MIPYECRRNTKDVSRKVDKDSGKRPKLNYGHRRRDLTGVSVIKIRPAAGKNKVRGRADRNKLSQPLNDPEYYCL